MPKSVLVVDDDARLAQASLLRLRNAGYEATHAATGCAGVEAAARLCPDAITLDIRLPDIDGFTVCERIRAMPHLRNTPIIFVSANSSGTHQQRALAVGGTAFLAKPCPSQVLLDTIFRLCEKQVDAVSPSPIGTQIGHERQSTSHEELRSC